MDFVKDNVKKLYRKFLFFVDVRRSRNVAVSGVVLRCGTGDSAARAGHYGSVDRVACKRSYSCGNLACVYIRNVLRKS